MKWKFLIGIVAIVIAIIAITVVLSSKHALILRPEGIIAEGQLKLIVTNIALMLAIILPTYFLLFWVIWKYCIRRKRVKYDPEHHYGPIGELIMWGLPSIIVAIMAFITWHATYQLDPYRPIQSDVEPLTIQVVALNWKWLFIYPEQGIASQNFLQIPEKTPIRLRLTADAAPMNSFWVPQLSGQIYSMTGMVTTLYLMANKVGEYVGRTVEINGEGYSDMVFAVKSTSQQDFDSWISEVKRSTSRLTEETYSQLIKPAVDRSVILFSQVPENHFHQIVHKYMYPAKQVL